MIQTSYVINAQTSEKKNKMKLEIIIQPNKRSKDQERLKRNLSKDKTDKNQMTWPSIRRLSELIHLETLRP